MSRSHKTSQFKSNIEPKEVDNRGEGNKAENEESEPLFYDALSRSNSWIRSNTCSPEYEHHENLGSLHGMLHKEEFNDNHEGFLHSGTIILPETTSPESLHRQLSDDDRSLKSKSSSLSKRFGKSLMLETRGCVKENSVFFLSSSHHVDCTGVSSPLASTSVSSRSLVSPIFPAKCQSEGIGWPFGISNCLFDSLEQRRMSFSPGEPNVKASSSNQVLPTPPPVPPSPSTGSWLDKAISLHTNKPSPLSSLQEREKASWAASSSSRKKLDFAQMNSNGPILGRSHSTSARKKLDFSLPDELPFIGSDFTSIEKNLKNTAILSTFSASSESAFNGVLMPLVTMHRKHKTLSSSSSAHEKKKTKNKKQVVDLVPDDQAVADVRWEDIVKGRQMEEGHIHLSKGLRHHHPTNLNTFKPLRL